MQAKRPSGSSSNLKRDNGGESITDSDRQSPHVDKKSAMWRCDVCKYETNVARNLRIHMTSEKHAHNVSMSAREEMFKRAGYPSDMSVFARSPVPKDDGNSTANKSSPSPSEHNPQSAALSAMYNYYLLASMQMMNGGNAAGNKSVDPQEMLRKIQQEQHQAEEQEKLAAQHQQMAMAQQYMQMLAHNMNDGGDRKTSSKSSVMMQQLLLQQQLNLWRQLLPQQQIESSSNANMNSSQLPLDILVSAKYTICKLNNWHFLLDYNSACYPLGSRTYKLGLKFCFVFCITDGLLINAFIRQVL